MTGAPTRAAATGASALTVSNAARGRRRPTAFAVAAAGTAVVVGLATLLVTLAPPAAPSGYLAPLVATASLILAILVRRTAPRLALAALVVGSLVATAVPIEIARAVDPGTAGLDEWLVAALRSVAAAIFTLALAARFATRPERRIAGRVTTVATVILAWFVAACLLVIFLIVTGNAAPDPGLSWIDVATLPTAVYVHLVVLLLALGALGDLRAAMSRVETRAGAMERERRSGSVLERATAVVRELIPGVDPGDAAVEAERTRLAGDLHAAVLPGLRRAIAEAEAGGPPELLAARLRTVDLELERLMADRWPVVLDTFGLVAAAEELAERIERESGRTVELVVTTDTGRPPVHAERAAWRIVQLAVDNAARHAGSALVTVLVETAVDRLAFAVIDEGRGFDPAVASGGAGRGLRDMERRARAIGADLEIESADGGGTVVRFTWPGRIEGGALQRNR